MERLDGKSLYLDANIFVYLLESRSQWITEATDLFRRAAAGGATLHTGDAALAEVLVGAYRMSSTEVEDIQALFATGLIILHSHPREAFLAAARIRGTAGGHLIDALHVATALAAGCDAVISHDARMPRLPEMPVLRLDELDLGQ